MTDNNRLARYKGRAALRNITENVRCFDCGRRSVLPGGNVELRRNSDGVAGFAGLFTCGKVWLCPVCNSKVMARRALEIGCALAWAHSQGLHVIWGSLTCRHTSQTALIESVSVQRAGWKALVSSHTWRTANATSRVAHLEHSDRCPWVCNFADAHVCGPDAGCEYACTRVYDTVQKMNSIGNPAGGRVGYIRAAELTIGANGFHPHFHPLILFRGTEQEAEWFAADVVSEWVLGVENSGGEAQRDGAQQLKVVSGAAVYEALTGYVTKSTYNYAGLALEAVWSQGKTGRGRVRGTVAHWTLLAAIEQGLSDEAGQWLELEEAMNGHRMITWSRGLRDFAGLNDEEDDATIAAKDIGSKDDAVIVITAAGWVGLRDNPVGLSMVLDVLSEHGWEKLGVLLDFLGIEWVTVDDLADVGDPVHREHANTGRDQEFADVSSF